MSESLPFPLAHKSYIKATSIQSCHYILELPSEDQCEFVESTPECVETVHYINYIVLIFCYLGKLYGIPLLCLWLLILCGFIATISIRFYTNSVLYLTRILGFSEILGGMTILCFGNSFNKLVSTMIQAENDTELFYNQILGTTIFLLTFTTGLIILQNPLQLHKGQFITITIFILAALLAISFIVYDSVIGLYEVFSLLSLFVIFFTITIIGHHRMKKIYKKRLKLSDDIPTVILEEDLTEVLQLRQFSEETNDVEKQLDENERKFSGWQIFLKYMTPYCKKEFRKSGKFFRGLFLAQTPFYWILLFVVPKVDYCAYERNWSKFNYLLGLVVYPSIAVYSFNFWDMTIFELPIIGEIFFIHVILLIFLLLALIVLCSSDTQKAPPYFNAFVVYSYFASIHLIYIILLELVSGLHTIGVVCGLQRASIGGTFLAWANGLINIFTNVTLCKRNFKRMAITSTFVEAFFILTIGIGSTALIRLLFHDELTYRFRSGVNGPTCLFYLFIIVFYNWMTTWLMKYQARRSLGAFMLVSYFIFVSFIFLCELQVLHPYGGDHIRQIENIDNDLYRIN